MRRSIAPFPGVRRNYRCIGPDIYLTAEPMRGRLVFSAWRFSRVDELGHIRAAVLIMAGEFIEREHSVRRAQAIPGSREIIVKVATHAAPTDKPDVVSKIILKSLEGSAE